MERLPVGIATIEGQEEAVRIVKFTEFEALARSEWDRIPEVYKEGVDGLIIERTRKASDGAVDVWTLGECLTESYPSEYDGPDSVRSDVVLYWGSFRELAADDAEFDWEQEVWETLTHELRHHLESLARESALDAVDAGLHQHYRRLDGDDFDPYYYRLGEARGRGWYSLEDAWFYETFVPGDGRVEFEWMSERYAVDVPRIDADVLLLDVVGGVEDPPGALCVVVVRRPGLGERLRALVARKRPRVEQHEVEAVRL